MSKVVIDYDKLNSAMKNADKTADKLGEYVNDLSRKVSRQYSSLEGGQSSKTNNSQYYINRKIDRLNAKKRAYETFSSDIKNLSRKAEDIDKEVAKKLNASKDDFINKHDYIETNWWTEVKEWFIDMKNKCPLFDTICNLVQGVLDTYADMFRELKHWYKCGGGKEWVGFGLAILGAVAAVLIAIASFPVSGIVAACAAIGACIAAANAIVNVVTSFKAARAKDKGDPAWAKVYGEQDSMQDVLRQTNFHNGFWNRMSYGFATYIDGVQLVCDVVAIYDGIKNVKNIYKEIKCSAGKGKVSFGKRFKQYLFDNKHYTSTDAKRVGWRKIIQKRGELRTLRDYGVTKARSLAQYEKTLTEWDKFAKKLKSAGKTINTVKDTIQKAGDFLDGKKTSPIKVVKGLTKKYQIPKTVFKVHDIYDKNWKKGFKYDINGFKYMIGKAG